MQPESTMRYYFIFTGIAIIEKTDKTSVGEDAEKLQPSYIAGRHWNDAATFESSLAALQNSTLHIYPRELKTYIHIKCCTEIFIEAIFITAQNENNTMSNWWMNK